MLYFSMAFRNRSQNLQIQEINTDEDVINADQCMDIKLVIDQNETRQHHTCSLVSDEKLWMYFTFISIQGHLDIIIIYGCRANHITPRI